MAALSRREEVVEGGVEEMRAEGPGLAQRRFQRGALPQQRLYPRLDLVGQHHEAWLCFAHGKTGFAARNRIRRISLGDQSRILGPHVPVPRHTMTGIPPTS